VQQDTKLSLEHGSALNGLKRFISHATYAENKEKNEFFISRKIISKFQQHSRSYADFWTDK